MRSLKQIKNIKGKTVLVRVDFNVPVKNGKVEDDFRIVKALPTIKFLQKKGAKLILITHLGQGGETLAPVAEVLNKFIEVKFIPEVIGPKVFKACSEMKNGGIILLENLRNNEGEQQGSKDFAEKLAKLADLYVNEAFSVSHREDASIVLLPKLLPAYAGFQLEEEVKNLFHAFNKPKHPFLFILGGAKFSTKIPLVEKYLKLADRIFIGGALVPQALQMSFARDPKIIFPVGDPAALDANAETLEILEKEIKKAKFILWNGPLGNYENGFDKGTIELAKMISRSKAISIIGGGDTLAALKKIGLNKFSFVSTGGGATLDFLANGTLPGLKALE